MKSSVVYHIFPRSKTVYFDENVELKFLFLPHLSPKLICELIVYPWSVVRVSFTMLNYLLRNQLADQSQILCASSLGRGNEILFCKFCALLKISCQG